MMNLAMQRKLDKGEALDVSPYRQTVGVYRLPTYFFELDIDYCDKETEAWIWSIGRDKQTGEIWAAVDARYYENDLFECLWLR